MCMIPPEFLEALLGILETTDTETNKDSDEQTECGS